MTKARTMRLAWGLGVLVTGLVVAHGIANLAGGGSFDTPSDRVVYGSVQVVAGGLIAAGLWLSERSHRGGMALVAGGVLAVSAVMPWFVVFTIPVGLGLIGLAHSRRPRVA